MERMAAGDGAAAFSLIDLHRRDLERSVRSIAGSRGARLSPEQVGDLVLDAAMAIYDVAGAWRPDGAPPWFYARDRIANAVDQELGLWCDELEVDRLDVEEAPAAACAEPSAVDVLDHLAADDHVVALLRDGLSRVATERDRLVFVEHRLQVTMGDPSPAVTVARQHGMKPEAVRQQTRRIKIRLQRLAAVDPRFGELANLPLVA